MIRPYIAWLNLVILCACALPVQAGKLWLNNGDSISGEPEELSGGELTWVSDAAGSLKISQLNIRFIQSDREMLFQIGQGKLLDACRFEVDDGKPVLAVAPARAAALNEDDPAALSAPIKSAVQAGTVTEGDNASPGQADPARAGTAGSDAPATQPEQWIMCEKQGFTLASWKGVSRFFEFKPPEADKMVASGKVVLFIDDESGNTNERTINLDIVAQFRYGKRRHIITIENDLESTSGTETTDERKVTYQFDRFFTQRWFWAGFGSWEENKFKDLSSKWIVATGPGYQFYETELLKLSVQGGLAYVDERFDDDDDVRSYPAIRAATDFSWLLHENGLKFIHTNLVYQSLDTARNWVIETDTGVTMPILGSIKAEFLFEYDYDNYPASTAVKEDRIWKMGFSYAW